MTRHHYPLNTTPPEGELHLRRLTLDEALPRLERFLHDSFMAGRLQVRIVHGKGTGTMRLAVWRQLGKHPLVSAYRLGGYGEGDSGVTVVELSRK